MAKPIFLNPRLPILFFIGWILSSCGSSHCETKLTSWKEEAPIALQQYLRVEEEIHANEIFIKAFYSKGSLFLRSLDTANYSKYNMPLLMKWFEEGHGYISIEETQKEVCYQECNDGSATANGCLIWGNQKQHYNSLVKVVDSISLDSGWYAHIVTCNGCLD